LDFAFSEEQEFLRSTAKEWLEKESPMKAIRAAIETPEGFDRERYAAAAELGWHAMAIPEEYGGAGFSFLELAVVLEELGRTLYPGPFFSSVILGANALLLGGSEAQKQDLLPKVAMGEMTLAVAGPDAGGLWDGSNVRSSAVQGASGWTIDGTKHFVLNAHQADKLIVAANADGECRLFLVDSSAVAVDTVEAMDLTRPMSTVTLRGAAADLLPDSSAAMLAKIGQIASVANALDQVGGASATLDAAVQYAKDRKQFGRPIGSFQAVKHKCATMLQKVESAKAAAYYAAWCTAEDNDELADVASLAKSYCSEAYFHCAAENIQITGGIGFTWEHDAHLYFKRAKSSELLFGTPAEHRSLVADSLGF
jgi:alkylation response protein AidB-like acyl-CoA dehydrogenase